MPRKKHVKLSAQRFQAETCRIVEFCVEAEGQLRSEYVDLVYDVAVIKLYTAFQDMVFEALTGAINNDTSVLNQKTNARFPKHLSKVVCEYIITGSGYFDFHGRDGLIKELKSYLPDSHYLLVAIKDTKRKVALERLCAMRNLAAHDSSAAKKAALRVIEQKNIPRSAGKWLKTKDQGMKKNRFREIATCLVELAEDIERQAPY